MARTKEFDPDVVLRRALDLFWASGYEATSMNDLVEHLGIARASLYATFGNKHDLYVKALDLYVTTLPNAVELLSQPGPVLPAVRAFIRSFADESACDERRRGCFVVNSAIELMPGDADVSRRVESSWDHLETVLVGGLIRARAQGEIAPDKDPHALARFLLVVIEGVRVLGKGHPNAERLHDGVDQALSVLT